MSTSEECKAARYAHRWQIRAHLIGREKTMAALAESIGITAQAVAATVSGKNNSPRVLDALREIVPEKLLFDPRRMHPAGKEAV